MIYAIAILGLNLLTGFNGQFSLGHSAFYAHRRLHGGDHDGEHGASATIWTLPAAGARLLRVRLPVRPAGAAARRHLSGARDLRARDRDAAGRSNRPFEHWTGGVQGIVIIKPDAPFGLPLNSDQWLYLFTLAVALVMYVCAANLVNSRTGRALMAIRDNPIAASAMGINVVALQVADLRRERALYRRRRRARRDRDRSSSRPTASPSSLAVALFVGLVVGGVGSIPGTICSAASSCCSCRTSPSMSRRASPGAVYGVILLLVSTSMPSGRRRAWCAPLIGQAGCGNGALQAARDRNGRKP